MKALASEIFSSDFRIKSRKTFLQIQQNGKKARSYNFLICTIPCDSEKVHTRLGITVTTKVNKRAKERNRIKRQIREFFRKNKSYFFKELDIVVIAMQGASQLKNVEMREELTHLFRKAGILARSAKE